MSEKPSDVRAQEHADKLLTVAVMSLDIVAGDVEENLRRM